MNGRAGKARSKGARSGRICLNLTSAFQKKFYATEPVHSSACVNVAQRGDNQMAIAKKTRDTVIANAANSPRARGLSLARTLLRLNDVAE
jgi:hypothetical protein